MIVSTFAPFVGGYRAFSLWWLVPQPFATCAVLPAGIYLLLGLSL